MCANRDNTHCVIGGRNLLKIFSIEETQFIEKANLVTGAKRLNYSTTDVKWHPIDENIIASSAGNGAVILWDMNRISESKQDHVFQHHYRYVNKLCFHPSEAAWLMSCSQDGDMHCFDIRQKKVSVTFCGKSDGIRDIQFHPTDKNIFCAASESGYVLLWDMRRPDHLYNQFAAHNGPVFTLNWHPEDYYRMATGGRDKTIKIWDTQVKTHPINTIQTISPVACIKWRPSHKYHIASCALILDNNVTIWDVRRPYVPFASFEEHTDVATGIIWHKDPDVILSSSKDKLLYHHAIVDAQRPAENAAQVALSFSSNGLIAHATPDNSIMRRTKQNSEYLNKVSTQTLGFLFQSSAAEFKPVQSSLTLGECYETESSHSNEALLGKLANEYKFCGKSFSGLCEHNANVSIKYGLSEKALTWSILKQLYGSEEDGVECMLSRQNKGNGSISSTCSSLYSSDFHSHRRRGDDMSALETSYNNKHSSLGDEEGDEDGEGIHTPSSLLQNDRMHDEMTMVVPELDDVFGDEDYSRQLFASDLEIEEHEELDSVPVEAIQLRQSLGDKARIEEDDNLDYTEKSSSIRPLSLSALDVPDWEFEFLIKDMLYFYAEQGDIQMCVTVLLVLKNRIKDLICAEDQEEWYNGYLDILSQLQLFGLSTEIIKCAPDPVNTVNQNSTTVRMQCGACSKPLLNKKSGCYCDHCKKITQTCSICHIPVKGLFSWCQGCGHGGHLHHLKEWYENYKYCPAGCGHKCEYS